MSTFTAVGPALDLDGPLPSSGPGNAVLDLPDRGLAYSESLCDCPLCSWSIPDLGDDLWREDGVVTAVLACSHSPEMIGSDASGLFAQVVDLHSGGDFSEMSAEDHLMGTHVLQGVFDPPVSPLVFAANPDPALSVEPEVEDFVVLWPEGSERLARYESHSSGVSR